ncbi:hypothetical protein [Methylomonas methanica]|uniref:DUF4145 domain-containing protein n=1 Tax=Methylomonas methanica (strain DSM 25384 / MC09) TaxID=857087 RepID=G0A385_METMM|nr:hypothetical protein [Methylomonas methanica]AEF99017.1 hypothetical protein Metme_0573 [Methylomonas methanica MC09]
MILNIKKFDKPDLLIAAAETEDEVGTVLRIHLAVEQVLVWYINHKKATELKPYVKEPREFGNKLSLAAAFGLPVAFVRVIHQINNIRNKLAHGDSELSADQVQELARQVDKLVEIDNSFVPLSKRYIELPVKRPGERMVFGVSGTRLDFLIATMAFYGVAMNWAATQVSIKSDVQPAR